MEEFITNWFIPLLFYSGPLLTLGTVAILYPTKSRIKFFWISTAVHVLAFVPFVVLILIGNHDALHALIVPALTGFILFAGGLVYLVYVAIKSKQIHA